MAVFVAVDLDHFKEVNDRHGHLAGGGVLAAVAEGLRAEVRDHDLVGRFGGEEFVVLLAGLDVSHHADGSAVLAIAERNRSGISGAWGGESHPGRCASPISPAFTA